MPGSALGNTSAVLQHSTPMEGKIDQVYATDKVICYQVTNPLSAWISLDKQNVLFGYGILATPAGMLEAHEKGLQLTSSELGQLKTLVENLTLHKAFEELARQGIQLTPAVKLVINTRTNYGRFITVKKGVDRFACMSFRRYPELLGLIGNNYLD